MLSLPFVGGSLPPKGKEREPGEMWLHFSHLGNLEFRSHPWSRRWKAFFSFFLLGRAENNAIFFYCLCAWKQWKTMSESHNVTTTQIPWWKNWAHWFFLVLVLFLFFFLPQECICDLMTWSYLQLSGIIDSRFTAIHVWCWTPGKSLFVCIIFQETFHVLLR